MSFAPSHSRLRLVESPDRDAAAATWPDEQRAKLAVMKENRIAASTPMPQAGEIVAAIDTRDPRWILAMQTQSRLQGATLPPEHRDQLLRSGTRLGLRPFEANMVIALMQDRARRGQSATDASAMLSLVHPPLDMDQPAKSAQWPQWLAAIAAGAAVAAALIRWIGS